MFVKDAMKEQIKIMEWLVWGRAYIQILMQAKFYSPSGVWQGENKLSDQNNEALAHFYNQIRNSLPLRTSPGVSSNSNILQFIMF
jgi:hypothetical protein